MCRSVTTTLEIFYFPCSDCNFVQQIGDIDKEVTLPIHKADRRYFPLYRDTKQEPWGIISNVKTEYGSKVITISGVLKVSVTVQIKLHRSG